MDSFFFRVEHDLLRSEAFQQLGGSAIKVYLTIGLHADFQSGWAYPSIRTIARQAGLSRQTVLTAIDELSQAGLLAVHKSRGRSTAYKILRQAPQRPAKRSDKRSTQPTSPGPKSFEEMPFSVPKSFHLEPDPVPESCQDWAWLLGPPGRDARPKQDSHSTREDTTTIPIPGTPFRLSAEGRLLVAVDLQELLTDQGIPPRLAEKLAQQKDPEAVAKVLLNAFYLRSQGKLHNAPGYIRAGIEDGYDLLPEVANRLKLRRRELEARQRMSEERRAQIRQEAARAAEEAAIEVVLQSLSPQELERLLEQAVASLPTPLVRRNPTLSNPFIRSKVYELAGGSDLADEEP
jgi:biotin operon repressor